MSSMQPFLQRETKLSCHFFNAYTKTNPLRLGTYTQDSLSVGALPNTHSCSSTGQEGTIPQDIYIETSLTQGSFDRFEVRILKHP